jgi:hypothetical protein
MTRIESLPISVTATGVTYYLASHFFQRPPSTSLQIAILVGFCTVLLYFVVNLVASPWLSDSPRVLSDGKKRRITEHLEPFSPCTNPSMSGKIVDIYAIASDDDKVNRDIDGLCESIQSAIKMAKWGADLCGTDNRTFEPPRYSQGIWICGKDAFTGNPCAADLLQDALRRAGMKARFDPMRPWPGICIVVGLREDRCFLPWNLRGWKREKMGTS